MKNSETRTLVIRLFDNPKQMLTVRQVAEALGNKERTIREWIYRGELPAIRLNGKDLRVLAADVEALLAPAYPNAGRMPQC